MCWTPRCTLLQLLEFEICFKKYENSTPKAPLDTSIITAAVPFFDIMYGYIMILLSNIIFLTYKQFHFYEIQSLQTDHIETFKC